MPVTNNTYTAESNTVSDSKPQPMQGKAPSLVLWWAAVGLLAAYIFVSVYGQWFLSDNFKPSPTGADPISNTLLIAMRCLELLMITTATWFWWKFLIQPWRKSGRISWDGIFVLACSTVWLQDPMDNYFNFTFSYNAYFINMSSWAMYIPGWESPRQNFFAEPILFMGGMFMWLFFGSAVLGCWFLNKSKQWWPNLSVMGHLVLLFCIFFLLDLVFESLLCRTGLFAYGGAYKDLTLWAGEYYQFPLYESSGIATVAIGATCLRYFRDDKGQCFVEKGLTQLRYSQRTKSLISFLAIFGFIQAIVFVGFFVPYTWFALKADSYPKLPSYMLMTICGKGTPYACPSREVPIPSLKSLAISPDDPRLSADARQN